MSSDLRRKHTEGKNRNQSFLQLIHYFDDLFMIICFCRYLPGSLGAFCKVRQTDKRMLDFYSKLGCFEVAKMEGFPKDVIIMGRSL